MKWVGLRLTQMVFDVLDTELLAMVIADFVAAEVPQCLMPRKDLSMWSHWA